MGHDAWKKDERKVCRLAGADRTGPTGREGPDCDQRAPWAIQVKRSSRGPALTTSWVRQSAEDALLDGRPWLLVNVVPRVGKQSLMLATCIGETLARYASVADFPTVVARRPGRIELRRRDLDSAMAAKQQPWVIVQHVPARVLADELRGTVELVTLDYRLLCQLATDAGAITTLADEAREGGPPA